MLGAAENAVVRRRPYKTIDASFVLMRLSFCLSGRPETGLRSSHYSNQSRSRRMKTESGSVRTRRQSSENSIYVGNSAIRTVPVHLANTRLVEWTSGSVVPSALCVGWRVWLGRKREPVSIM